MWGLDQMEIGENPYKVDQLQAMRWIAGSWRDLHQSVFANCWKHTGLFAITETPAQQMAELLIDPTVMDPNINDAELSEDFERFIRAANIRTAMSLDNFLNPPNEDASVHLQLVDEELWQSVQEVEQDQEQEEAENEAPSPYLNLPINEKIIAIARAIALVEEAPEDWKIEQQTLVQQLRRLQRGFRREHEWEQELKRRQRPLTDFFVLRNGAEQC